MTLYCINEHAAQFAFFLHFTEQALVLVLSTQQLQLYYTILYYTILYLSLFTNKRMDGTLRPNGMEVPSTYGVLCLLRCPSAPPLIKP